MSDAIDPLPIETESRGGRISAVWLVPVLALVIAVGVAVQNYAARGPLIEVTFANASGVHAGETELRYRDIAVGLVEAVGFSDSLDEVIVAIRLDKDMAAYVDDGSRFWVVRPEVTAQGVSGLDTVLSGVYIEGDWDGTQGAAQTSFSGSEAAPLLAGGATGTTLVLTSAEALPPAATPILYRGVEVGELGEAQITADGLGVFAEAVVYAPHDRLISSSTRFWDISGVSFSIGAAGASLDFSSLASLIAGGVTFDTLGSGGTQIAEGSSFELFPDEETARERFLLDTETGGLEFQVVFEDNLPGLTIGSAVQLGGVRIGEVTSISGISDEARFGDTNVRLLTTLRLVPGRIGFAGADEDEAFLDFLDRRIEDGLRARLSTASLFSGGLRVDLVDLSGATGARLDATAQPFPQIPSAPPNVTNVGASAQDLLQRVEALPVEEVMDSIIAFLDASTALVADEDLQAAPADLRAVIASIRAVVDSDEVAALPSQIGAVANGLETATQQITTLLSQIEEAELLAELSEVLEAFEVAAASVPGLSERAGSVLAGIEELALGDLVSRAGGLVDSADALIAGDAVQALPAEMSAALDELRGTLTSARSLLESDEIIALPGDIGVLSTSLQDTAGRLNALVAEVEGAAIVTKLAETIESVSAAADTLPGLAEQASAVLSEAEALSLQDLADRADGLLASAEEILDQDSARALPSDLSAALTELGATLSEVREGGLVDNANVTLASAREAALALAEASESLPALAARLNTLAGQAGVALGDYSRDGQVGRDLTAAIRQIEVAAAALERLARQLSRNPSSLLTGR